MFPRSKVWISYTDHQLKLKFKYPASLFWHEWFHHLAPVLIHCLWGLHSQACGAVASLQVLDADPPARAAITRKCIWHCSSGAGERQTDRQHCSVAAAAYRALQSRGSLEGIRSISLTSSIRHRYVTEYVKFRRKQRVTLLAQLLYSLCHTYEPWPATRPLQQWRSNWASQSVFDSQLPRWPLAKPKTFCMWHFFLSLSFWLCCATVKILRLPWIETRIF